ncbi:MAG: PAP2 family protein [Bacteroidia bacterium]
MRSAKIISYLFHPLLMPLFGVFLIFNFGQENYFLIPLSVQKITYQIIFGFTLALPILCLIALKYSHQIKNFELKSQEERRLPYVITAVFFTLAYASLKFISPNSFPIIQFLLGATISLLLVMLINLEFKISAHTTGIGGITGLFTGVGFKIHVDLHLLIMSLFFISGCVAYARLHLKAHRPMEVYAGFFLGFLSELIVVLFV